MKLDAVIVGARCAGAATALLLARAGARVLLVDKGTYASDTLSTHALMRGAVLELKRWGVLPAIAAACTPPVTSTTFSYSQHDVGVRIEERYGVDALYAPRRALLDRVLVDAAAGSGADISYGVRLDDLIVDDRGRVRGITTLSGRSRRHIEAEMVIGADGLYSTVAQRLRAPNVVVGRHAAGVLFTYWHGLANEGYYWKFAPGASVGAIPTNQSATCLFAAVPAWRFREEVRGDVFGVYRRWIREVSPTLDARLDDATRVERVRGFGGHLGFIKQSTGPGWALVGDAGYFKDPLTAHGITDALRDADLLARAILQGTTTALSDYERTRHDLSIRLFELTDEIASFSWSEDHLQSLHRALSQEMSREVRALAGLGPIPASGHGRPASGLPLPASR